VLSVDSFERKKRTFNAREKKGLPTRGSQVQGAKKANLLRNFPSRNRGAAAAKRGRGTERKPGRKAMGGGGANE